MREVATEAFVPLPPLQALHRALDWTQTQELQLLYRRFTAREMPRDVSACAAVEAYRSLLCLCRLFIISKLQYILSESIVHGMFKMADAL